MGLDNFSEETEVFVLDVSLLLNKKFSDSIKAESRSNKIKRINSLHSMISEIRDIKKQSYEKITCINYMIPLGSIRELCINIICYFYFKESRIRILSTLQPGIPVFKQISRIKKVKEIASIRLFFNKLYAFTWSRVKSPMGSLVKYKLIAGNYYKDVELVNYNNKYKVLNGHSFDYDRYLSSKNVNMDSVEKNIIVFLDEPGPLFSSDYKLTGDKVHKTVDVWYPALCRFFDKIETLYNAKVVIAAHYKSVFTSPSAVFGGREVFYGKTKDLIMKSKLVITEQSSAVSFAIIYEKPLMFIYSDESKKDLPLMNFMNNMIEFLDLFKYNINYLDTIPELLPAVNRSKYILYKHQFLTSDSDGRTNEQLIEQEILN